MCSSSTTSSGRRRTNVVYGIGANWQESVTDMIAAPVSIFRKLRIDLSLISIGFLALTLPVLGQTAAPTSQTNENKPPAYDVVSIRPHKDNGNYSHWLTPTSNGYAAYNVQVFDLIFAAYELKSPGQLVGLPQWAYEESFDLEAKLDENALPAHQKLSDRERREQAAPMLRSMLADRFDLKVHHETRELAVYELVVGKGGFKLKQSQGPENLGRMMTNRGRIFVRAGPIGARFIAGLSDAVGRIVLDKTGLTSYYDIDLKWTPDGSPTNDPSAPPDLFSAIQEQLGLKLVPSKAPVDVLVVDHVERPTEN